MSTSNEDFFDALVRHQIGLSRLSSTITNQVVAILDSTESDIKREIKKFTRRRDLSKPISAIRLQSLTNKIISIRRTAWTQIAALWTNEMNNLVLSEPEFMSMATKTVLPVKIEPGMPEEAVLLALLIGTTFEGRTLDQWIQDSSQADVRRIIDEVNIGIMQQETANTISSRVVGTTAAGGTDGATQTTRNALAALTVTMITHFSNQAKKLFYIENFKIITKERYTAILDSGTTAICRSLNGRLFFVGEGYFPPIHRFCRSTRIAIYNNKALATKETKLAIDRQSLSEYTRKNNLTSVSSRGALPVGHRGKFDQFSVKRVEQLIGGVPDEITTNEFFLRQSKAFQDEALGVTKAKLWRDGGLPLTKFVNRVGDELTLSELAVSDSNAFIKAGLDPDNFI